MKICTTKTWMKTLSILSVGVVASACGSSLNVLKDPTPSPVAGTAGITIMVPTYEDLKIGDKSFDDYLAEKVEKAESKGKEAKEATDWPEMKDRWANDFVVLVQKELGDVKSESAKELPGEGIVVKANFERIEPGFYAYAVSRPSYTTIRITVFDAQKPDDVLFEAVGNYGTSAFTLRQRVGGDIARIGRDLGKFLKKRLAAEG